MRTSHGGQGMGAPGDLRKGPLREGAQSPGPAAGGREASVSTGTGSGAHSMASELFILQTQGITQLSPQPTFTPQPP